MFSNNICGNCDKPMTQHIEIWASENVVSYDVNGDKCTRFEDNGYTLTDDFYEVEDYDFYNPLLEVSDVTTSHDITREDEAQGIWLNRDNYQRLTRDSHNPNAKIKPVSYGNFSYRDTEPNRVTHATSWTHRYVGQPKSQTRSGNYPDRHLPKSYTNRRGFTYQFSESATHVTNEALNFDDVRLMTLEFHELQAFASSVIIDYGITEAYQYKVFNAFIGYDNLFHVGSVILSADKTAVKCSQCKVIIPVPATTDRDQQESFVHSVIRHGNNHGPKWLTSRSDFTYIHADVCDGNHRHSEPCRNNKPVVRIPTIADLNWEDMLQFLINHRKFCTSADCRCTNYYHLLNERNYGKVA